MSPLVLAAIWVAAGVAAAPLARLVRRRGAAAAGPLIAGLAGLAATVTASPGPLGSVTFGAALQLNRPAMGLLVAAGVACAITLVLAPGLDGGEVLGMGLVGAAAVIALSATVALIWALALAMAVGFLALRWISSTPDRSTLSTGRVAGMGAAALLACAVLVPLGGTPSDVRSTVGGALLAAGACALLGLVPTGGWAAAAASAVRGADLAAWALLLAPAVLLTTGAALGSLSDRSQATLAGTLLVLGLISALYGGLLAILTPVPARYGRLLLADLGMAAAGIGCRQDVGRLGVLVIVLSHLATAPLLLHAPRPGLQRPHRLAWLALTGLPLSAGFWGRLLVLEALAATAIPALAVGLAASALMLAAAMRALLRAAEETDVRGVGVPGMALGWAVAAGALAIGVAPSWTAARVFGVELGG